MNLPRWWRAAAGIATELFGWLSRPLRRVPKIYRVRSVEELPDRLQSSILYIVAEDSLSDACFDGLPSRKMQGCPEYEPAARRRSRLDVSIRADGRPSLKPSVWRKPGCGCHFWMRDGRVHWC
jgi:hypothetical protein